MPNSTKTLPGPVLVRVPVVGVVFGAGVPVVVAFAIALFAESPAATVLEGDVLVAGDCCGVGVITGLWLTCCDPLGDLAIGDLGLL